MAYDRPSLEEIRNRIKLDIVARLPQLSPELRNSVTGILATAEAGAVFGLYSYLSWALRQPFPDTAEQEYLDRWGAIKGVERIPARKSSGTITVTGTTGSTVSAGKILASASGFTYVTTQAVTLSGPTAAVPIEAQFPGAEGNLPAGITLTFQSPDFGIQAASVIASDITNGNDVEGDQAYRVRVLAAFAQPPRGGARYDYVNWSREASVNINRAFVYAAEDDASIDPGAVHVYIMAQDGIPSPSDVSTVAAYIDERKPITAAVSVFAPVASPLDLTIQLDPNTTAVQEAVTSELQDLINREAEPNGTIFLSKIREAISRASGEENHILVSPVADVTETSYEITTLGTITFQPIP